MSVGPARRLVAIVAASGSLFLVRGGDARADEAREARESMRDASVLEASAFVGGGATALTLDLVAPGAATPRWTGPILFDDAARSALAQTSEAGRARAATASDVAVGFLVARPFFEALVSTVWGRIDAHVTLELAITDLEAFSVTETLTFASKRAFARQRPEAQEAGCDRADAPASASTATACGRADRNSSFWSGHTAFAFTAAGLLCTEHLKLALYGAPLDVFACVATLTTATGTGALRIVADRHWASDVVTGAVIGGLSGWLVPTLLRFRSPRAKAEGAVIVPAVAPVEGGIALGVAAVGW
jgi:membrane-associated phospholipid phosphatase